MANNERITSVIDLQSTQRETKELLSQLKEIDALIRNMPKIKTEYKAASGAKEHKVALQELEQANQRILQFQRDLDLSFSKSKQSLEDYKTRTIEANRQVSKSFEDLVRKREEEAAKLAEIRKKIKDLSQFSGLGGEAGDKVKDEIVKLRAEEAQLAEQVKKTNQVLKAHAQEQVTTANSIAQAHARVKALRAERDNLDLSTDSGRAQAKALNDQINALDEFIEKENDLYTQRKINIGNYRGAAAVVIEAMERQAAKIEELKEKQQGLVNVQQQAASQRIGFKWGKEQEDQLNQINAQLATTQKQYEALSNIVQQPAFVKAAEETATARVQIQGFTTALMEMKRKGLGNSPEAKELEKQIAELGKVMEDTKAEIKAMKDEAKMFTDFASGVSFAASAVETFAGAQALLGTENEHVEETIKGIVAIQAVANGTREIATQITEKGTVANKAYAVVQGLVKKALDSSASATTRLAAATKLLMGGLVIGGLVFLISKVMELAKAASKLTAEQRAQNDVLEKAADAYAQARSQVDKLYQNIERARKGFMSKKDALKEYNDSLGKTIGFAKDLNEAEKKMIDNAEVYIQYTLLKAKAEAAAALKKEELKKMLLAEAKSEVDFTDTGDAVGSILGNALSFINPFKSQSDAMLDVAEDTYKKGKKKKEEAIKESQEMYDELTKMEEKFQAEADELAKKYKFRTDDKSLEEVKKEADAIFRARMELKKYYLQKEMELQNAVAGMEGAAMKIRLAAVDKSLQAELELIETNNALQLRSESLTEADKIRIVKEAEDAKNKARVAASVKVKAIHKKEVEAQKEAAEEAEQVLRDSIDKRLAELERQAKGFQRYYDEEAANLKRTYDKQNIALDKKFAQGLIKEEEYNKEKLRLHEDFLVKSLKLEIQHAKRQLEIAEEKARATGNEDDIAAAAAARSKLADLEISLDKLVTDQHIASNERKKKSDEDLFQKQVERLEKIASISQEVYDTIGGFMQNSIDRQTNALQERQDKLEENYEKEVENINNSVLSEEDKANRLKIIEAQRFAQTEQIERKRRQLEVERARFEKFANIASIISETSLAVVRALGAKPWQPGNIAMAAVVGAIGAANLVKAIAAPLPKFREGTDSSPEGWALTDEDGPEMYIEPSGKTYMGNDGPTIRYLKKGTRIIPYDEVNKIMLASAMQNFGFIFPKDNTGEKIGELKSELRELVQWQTQVLKEAYKSKQTVIVHNKVDYWNSEYVQRNIRN